MQSVQRGLKVSVKPKLLISWRCGGGGHGQRCATLRLTLPQSAARTQEGREALTLRTVRQLRIGGGNNALGVKMTFKGCIF